MHYSTSEISSGSLDIHSRRSALWRHYPNSDVSVKKSEKSLYFLNREYRHYSLCLDVHVLGWYFVIFAVGPTEAIPAITTVVSSSEIHARTPK